MDLEKLGHKIAVCRKNKGITQAQLAHRLNISDKAISKWERGTSSPDLEQLQNMTIIFGVSYEQLLDDNLEINIIDTQQQSPNIATKRQLSADEWYRLDNSANVYPNDLKGKGRYVFRLSAVLKEKVKPEFLQQAVNDSVDRFPTLMVTIKAGAFWYYFERMTKLHKIEVDTRYPMEDFKLNGKNYLFRVLYHNCRISLEVFHSISDGIGAMTFLKSIIARYYELTCGKIQNYEGCLSLADFPTEEENEDSFQRYSNNDEPIRRIKTQAFKLEGKLLPKHKHIMTSLVMSVDKLKELMHSKKITVTEFFAAVIIRATMDRAIYIGEFDKPIVVQIPVDLRKIFPSKTIRNFVSTVDIEVSPDHASWSVEDLTMLVRTQMEQGVVKYNMQAVINTNVRDERSFIKKITPLFIKKLAISTIKHNLTDKSITLSFSNIGNTNVPKELYSIVDRLEFFTKARKSKKINISCISFNNKCVLSFDRIIQESYLERSVAKILNGYGLDLAVDSNSGDEYEIL